MLDKKRQSVRNSFSPATEILSMAAKLRVIDLEEKGVASQLHWANLTDAQKVPWIIKANKVLELY